MKKLNKDVSLSVIAMRTPGFNGADLANLMNQAAILANPFLISKNQLLARIVGGLGERAEEEVIFDETEITTRVAVDLQQITQIARQMVTRFGMSEIGPWALTDPAVQGHHVGASNLYYASFQKNDITEIETIGCSEPVGFIITKIDEFWQLK
ncbi:hypothetical protein JHK87_033597 [Glycine soja]|nr:hypothetical protein JHK87_033597 [Glycine soja]